MRDHRRAVRSRLILVSVAALLGTALPALPAAATETPAPTPSAGPVTPGTDSTTIPTDQFIVKFKDRAGIQSIDPQKSFNQAANAVGVPVKKVRTTGSGEQVVRTDRKLGGPEAKKLVATLAADPSVQYAEPDAIMRPLALAPNDSLFKYQWNLGAGTGGINVLGAWDVSQGQGSVVAVVDTGILPHSDLDANVLPGYDMISDPAVARDGDGRDPNPRDEGDATSAGQCAAGEAARNSSWHGTHVAGIIAAVAGNGQGIAGVAPKAKIVPVRAIGTCGGYTSDIADGIRWAAGGSVSGAPANANPARVINLSLGGQATCSSTYQNAVDFARSQGAVVVAAAGNDNIDASQISPANCQGVMAVGASTRTNVKAYYSNFGPKVDIYAPGGDMTNNVVDGIVSTLNDGTDTAGAEAYYLKAGTSMAAPHVAGVAALMLSKFPAYTPDEVRATMLVTASTAGGVNLVNAGLALRNTAQDATPLQSQVPVIDGQPTVGNTLSTTAADWVGIERATVAYQWQRDGVAIPDAVSPAYTLAPADVNAAISVTVTATKSHFPAVSATSAATSPVQAGTLTRATPVISGSAYVGNMLSVDAGTWGPAPVSLAYQWSRGGVPIDGATAAQYTLTEADTGATVTATVTATKDGYQPTSVTSDATAEVVTADKAVAPEPVTFTDAPYMADDKYTIPASANFDYQVDGTTTPAGTYPARGQVKVVAKVHSGFALLTGAQATWTAYFSTKGPAFTAPAQSPFTDVTTTQPFYTEMAWLADRKISTGWVEADKSVTYRPSASITRDAMAAFLYRMAGSPDYTPPAVSPFTDVATTQPFYKEMSWLAQTGISSGWIESNGSHTYRPLTSISRDAMAAFLYRLANKPDFVPPATSPFFDVSPGQLFYKEMTWLADQRISTGWQETPTTKSYRALSPINRDAMAAFLYRMP
ncbi:S8 family serine peptidase [Arthrobacter sp. efr-133-TYG-104]|uniref:S8 family serine peptidase n=1 Tax=Arthrobacter sp. efr-133-TYG-104 TaxID=3040324 RepID=UPI00254FBC57|nr:S8 family serine peptidase [Arthrobacter sp. efr-133-TYG-104]